jgi:hypothetical protein
MAMKITHDAKAPTASIELMITNPLPDYDLEDVQAAVPREIDPILASQGFKDLLDETRGMLDRELAGSGLEIVQLTGAICRDNSVHRPGIWLVLRQPGAAVDKPMPQAAQAKVNDVADKIRAYLQLS